MSRRHREHPLRTPQALLASTVVLFGLLLAFAILFQWFFFNKAELRAHHNKQMSAFARTGLQRMEALLAQDTRPDQLTGDVKAALGEILLFKDPNTGSPFFSRVSLSFDPAWTGDAAGRLDLDLWTDPCHQCETKKIPLYHPRTRLLIGIATSYHNPVVFDAVANKLEHKLLWMVAIVMMLTAAAGWRIWRLVRELRESERTLRESERTLRESERNLRETERNLFNVFEAVPFPIFLKGERINQVQPANPADASKTDVVH